MHQRDGVAPARDLGREHESLRLRRPVQSHVDHVHQQHGPRDDEQPTAVLRGDLCSKGSTSPGSRAGTTQPATRAPSVGAGPVISALPSVRFHPKDESCLPPLRGQARAQMARIFRSMASTASCTEALPSSCRIASSTIPCRVAATTARRSPAVTDVRACSASAAASASS